MKDEIKEILDKFDKVLENYELDKKFGQMSVDSICHLFPNEMITIKDCITNLREENKELKNTIDFIDNKYKNTINYNEKLIEYNQDYKSRNEKAIEYINKELKNMPINGCYERLAKILFMLGSDKDES